MLSTWGWGHLSSHLVPTLPWSFPLDSGYRRQGLCFPLWGSSGPLIGYGVLSRHTRHISWSSPVQVGQAVPTPEWWAGG